MPALGAFCKCKSTSVSCLKVAFILLCTYNIELRCDVWWAVVSICYGLHEKKV